MVQAYMKICKIWQHCYVVYIKIFLMSSLICTY